MTSINNPLRQYFRRPALYLRLPSDGKLYHPGVINMPANGELPVYPMTAIDEITSRTPDALFNGVAMTQLIKSCVPDINDPWAINSVDFDAILIAIKAASGGNDMEIESQCESCEEIASYNVNLTGILAQLKSGNYDNELQINELSIKYRPLNYKEMNDAGLAQFEIQKAFVGLDSIEDEEQRKLQTQKALSSVTDLTMKVLTNTIEYIKTPESVVDNKEFILDFLKNCDKNVYMTIRDYNAKLKENTEIKPLKIKCIHCGHEYNQPFTLNTADFFA
jgi:hypothetical protein